MKNIKYIWLLIAAIGFTSCTDEIDAIPENYVEETVVLPALTNGNADFSNFVALGASFTAGFSDGGLFIAGQETSFPSTMAKQFAKIGGGDFTQPLMSDNTGGILVGGAVARGYRLVFGGAGPVPLNLFLASQGAPVPPITTEAGVNIGSNFNNFGIPGAKSVHLDFPGYAAFNPYYARIASAPASTVLADAAAQNPTFFTLSEIGGNDVLGYALSGGESDTSAMNYDPITPVAQFEGALNAIVSTMLASNSNNAKGAIGNVPNITSLSHFTSVPHNPIPLDAATADILNGPGAYGAYNAGIQQAFGFLVQNGLADADDAAAEIAKRTIMFSEAPDNAVVILDENLTDLEAISPAFAGLTQMRQATAEDLFVLPASSFIGSEVIVGNPLTVNGVAIPLADKWVLTPEEQEEIATATMAYNSIIESVVTSDPTNLALVDLNSILNQAATMGIQFDDYTMNTDLVFGGLVSLDGIHLTPRGYALMANSFLEAIDTTFGSNFVASGNVAKANDFTAAFSPLLP